MKYDKDIRIAGTGVWLPPLTPLRQAVAAGLVGEHHQALGYESVAVADDEAGADMAVRAARTAVRRAGLDPAAYDLVLHASSWFQGLDWWPAAAYVAGRSVSHRAVAVDVQQRSNGGLAALHLAAGQLQSGAAATALLTTGDHFAPPMIDRWATQFYTIYGDAGTALVLSTSGGFARLLSSAAHADTSLEPWSRADSPLTLAPGQQTPVPVLQRFITHSRAPESKGSWERLAAAMSRARDEALADANLALADIDRIVVPHVHRGDGRSENYDALGFTERQSVWEFGRRVGHLGAGDQFAALNHLVEDKALGPGDRVLVTGVGVGYSVTAAVVEILETPSL